MSNTNNNNLNAAVETGIDHDSLARIDSITDAVGHSKGPVLNGGYTDDLQPTLSGRLPMGEGQVLRVFCNNVVIGYANIGDEGKWSFTPDTPLEPGRTYDFQIILLDSGTSELLPSDAYTIHTTELDQDAAPDAPVITEVHDFAGDHQGVVAQGGKTDDSQPLVSGTAGAGDVVTVKVYSALHNHTYTLGSVVADADGHWSYQMQGGQDITNGLGEWTFTATATNSFGTSDISAGYSVETVATNADVFATPEISYIIDDVGLHTGQVTDGGKTDDRQPELHGTGEPGSVVTVKMYGPSTGKTYTLGHVTVGNDGTWHYQFTGKQAMQAGHGAENIFHVSSVDTDGHTVTSDAFTVTLTGSNADDNTPPDITPPDAPVITEVYDDVGTQQGPVANRGSTDDSQLKISGTAEHDSIVVISHVVESTGAIYVDGSVVADASGHWVFEMTGPFQPSFGNRIITATATDAAGNTSEPSDSFVVNFVDTNQDDITPPDQPTIDSFLDDAGNSLSGATTDDATPTLQGHAEANSIVNVYEGDTLLGSTTAKADGTWSYTTPERADGMHDFTVTATDAAGNISVPSADFVVDVETVDITPPDAPVITEVYDDQGWTQGPVANGGKTDDTLLTISGTAEHDSIVVISHVIEATGHTYIDGSVVADASGHWTFQMTGDGFDTTAHGNRIFTATATDAAGNTSETSDSYVVNFVDANMDTTHTEMSITGLQDDSGLVTGLVTDGGTTDDTSPVIFGTAEPYSRVYMDVTGAYGEHYYSSFTLASANTWHMRQTFGAGNYGTFSYSAYSVDPAGNRSETVTFHVNFVAPNLDDITAPDAPVITDYYADIGDPQGHFNDGTITGDNTPTLNGQAEANSIVKVYEGDTLLGSTTAGVDGTWSYTTPERANGKHDFTVTATDAAGNTSAHSADFVVDVEAADTTPPDAPVITEVYDDYGLTTGDVANGGKTDDSLLKISGTAEHDSIVVISHVIEATGHTYIDGSVVADASGHWAFQMTGDGFDTTTHGNRIFTATATDAAGNTSAPSDSYVVNFVDTNQDSTTPPNASGIESFNQADIPHTITDSFTTESGLVVKSLGGEIEVNYWPEKGPSGKDFKDEMGGYAFLSTEDSAGVNITLPGLADSVTFAVEYNSGSNIQAFDGDGNLLNRVALTNIGGNANNTLPVYQITAPKGEHIASFTVVGTSALDTIQWTSADAAHTAQQSALLTSHDAVDHHDIMTLAQVDDSHKSAAAVDITDHVQNTHHLTLNDIISEAHPNLFIQDGKQQLAVTGDQGDVVELKVEDLAHNTWQDSGAVTAGGIQYEVYQHAGSDVELLVQHGLELHQVA